MAHVPSAAFDFVQPQQQQATVTPSTSAPTSAPTSGGVHIVRNTSPIYNEMLGKRIALVPVCVDERQLHLLEADPNIYGFKIHVKRRQGSHDQDDDEDEDEDRAGVVLVTSKDIQVMDKDGNPVDAALRDTLFPACPITGEHILLTKLKPNPYGDEEELEVYCRVSIKTGEYHARWCPVSACYFVNAIDKKAADEAFSLVSGSTSRRNFDALQAMRYFHKNQYGEANAFEFRLESECGLRAAYLVYRGFTVLTRRITTIRTALENRDIDKVDIDVATVVDVGKQGEEDDSEGTVYDIRLTGEDHTCGNLIQAMIYQYVFRDDTYQDNNKKPISYVGYHQPHPLEHYIVLRVKVSDPSTNIEAFLIGSLKRLEATLEGFTQAWIDAASMREKSMGYDIK